MPSTADAARNGTTLPTVHSAAQNRVSGMAHRHPSGLNNHRNTPTSRITQTPKKIGHGSSVNGLINCANAGE